MDSAAKLIGRQRGLLVELDDEVSQLQSSEVGGAVVDYATNLQSPFPAVGNATAATHISQSQEALVSRFRPGL